MVSAARKQQRGLGWFVSVSAALAGIAGCAHQAPPPATSASAAPVTTLQMDPIEIQAVRGPDGVHVETFDAQDLFEQAGKALSEKRYDDAIKGYDRLLREFRDGRYTQAAIYNAGLAHQGKKEWEAAAARFKLLVAQYGDSADAKDALFQLGATYAEMGNWPSSSQIFAEILDRKDLTADDRLEAMARRGFAQFQLKDLDTSERAFRAAVAYYHQVEPEQRLQTDFYLGLADYHLGLVAHERFRAVPLRLPEAQMGRDMDEKARLLLAAQRQYIETIKLGNPQWASASGYQIGSMYEEFYDAFLHAPVPADYLRPENAQKLDVYYDELRRRVRILLEKSRKTHEANLAMMERLGVQNEWREKSRVAFDQLQRLLDPSFKPPFAAPGTAPPAAPPPPATPAAPVAASGGPAAGVPGTTASPPDDRGDGTATPANPAPTGQAPAKLDADTDQKHRPAPAGMRRQIL